MSADTPPVAQRHWLFWALASWVSALVLTFAGFVLAFHSGPWLSSGDSWSAKGAQLTVRGASRVDGDRVVFLQPAEDGNLVAVLNLESPIDARRFRFATVRATGGFPSGGMSFVWRVQGDERTVRRVELAAAGARIPPATLGAVDGWAGRIVGVGLIARGAFPAPLAVESIELAPSSVWTTMGGIASHWLEFEPWDGGSIHFMAGGNPSLKHPLPLFLGISFVAAIGTYLLLVVLGHTRFQPQAALAIALLGWAVIDARWQLNLWRQLDITRYQYAGKSWEDKRRAAEDGRLFEFMREARARIADPKARVFVFAEEEYDRMRGAYHLYPANVLALKGRVSLLPAETFKPGDVLVLYRKRGVEYSPADKRLRWDNAQAVKADMIHFSAGSGVFRVLPPG
jgi:hypothetical protein